jgi:hypothetical protein
MSGACLYWWGWSKKCQYLSNFGSGLQLDPWRRWSGPWTTIGLALGLDCSPRCRASSFLHDMQRYNLKNAHFFFHFMIKLQSKQLSHMNSQNRRGFSLELSLITES